MFVGCKHGYFCIKLGVLMNVCGMDQTRLLEPASSLRTSSFLHLCVGFVSQPCRLLLWSQVRPNN